MPPSYQDLEQASRGVIVHGHKGLKRLWAHLQDAQPDPYRTRHVLDTICDQLYKQVQAWLNGRDLREQATVMVMRGGLLFARSYWDTDPSSPLGIVVPHRRASDVKPGILYVDVPQIEGTYLVCDLIVNSGATVSAVIEAMVQIAPSIPARSIHVLSPFLTLFASRTLLANYPGIQLHSFWNAMEIGPDKRLAGLRFDGGDCVFGDGMRSRFPA